jgi:membrane-associated protein
MIELIKLLIDFILHIDVHLNQIVVEYGILAYGLLFLIILCETGLVITPFLPGDSLLFTAGALAAQGSLNVYALFGLLALAAFLGDTSNYWIGNKFGNAILRKDGRYIKKEHLNKTEHFFAKYGGKTIIFARFMPIVRTLAPFVAGIGKMKYSRFFIFNIIGGIVWVGGFVFAGFFFGNIPVVKENFTIVILVIIFMSFVPAIYEFVKHRMKKKTEPETKRGLRVNIKIR